MTAPLSPAAQAVWAAFNDAYEAQGPLEDMGKPIAAAFRAAVEQTIQPDPIMGTDSIIYAKHLFAIVTELESDS